MVWSADELAQGLNIFQVPSKAMYLLTILTLRIDFLHPLKYVHTVSNPSHDLNYIQLRELSQRAVALRFLRAENMPLMAGFLYQQYRKPGQNRIPEPALRLALSQHLEQLAGMLCDRRRLSSETSSRLSPSRVSKRLSIS